MKVPKTVIVDAPCPLCHRDDTPGPYTCKRCGLDICKDCCAVTDFFTDKHHKRVLCKPCLMELEAEAVVDGLAAKEAPKENSDQIAKATMGLSHMDTRMRRFIEGLYDRA